MKPLLKLMCLPFICMLLAAGSPQANAQIDTIIVPYLAEDYKYQQVAGGGLSGFEASGFNDAAWPTGSAGFGTIGGGCPLNNESDVNTTWSVNTDILVRKHFDLPQGAGLRVSVAIDNDVQVFVNGHDISGGLQVHEGCATLGSFVFTAPSTILNVGDNLIAVRGRDRGADTYLDIQITADLPQVYTVTGLSDFEGNSRGSFSLRDAIGEANATLGVDTIKFNIPGGGVQPCSLVTALPDITDAVVIDGYTQPGASPNTLAVGSNAVLNIEVFSNYDVDRGFVIRGGGSTIRGLVINRFQEDGIALWSDNNRIEGNFIGTNPTGSTIAGNSVNGISVDGSSNLIGGSTPGARNVISGNEDDGVDIYNGERNIIAGNYIGVAANGSARLRNGGNGVNLHAGKSVVDSNTVGGNTSGARNVISGNENHGVRISYGYGNTIQGNYVGLDATGTSAIGNDGNGVAIVNFSGGNTVRGNVISGNGDDGISLVDVAGNAVQGNKIGTNASGTSPLGNQGDGISVNIGSAAPADNPRKIQTSGFGGNTIGGSAEGASNTIAYNDDNGVVIYTSPGNAILENSIFENGELGIDLGGDGVGFATKLVQRVEGGPNNYQDFPELHFAAFDLQGVAGSMFAEPLADYEIRFYRNIEADPSGYGEGEEFIGSTSVTTNGDGLGVFYAELPGELVAGEYVTATATDNNNNTSEFSGAVLVSARVKAFGDHFVVNTTLSGIPLHWQDGNAVFHISDNVPAPFQSPLTDGFMSWSDLAQLSYTYGGTTPNTTWGGEPDGVNNNVWVTDGWEVLTGTDANVIAVTRVRYNTLNGAITDADIAYDAQHFAWEATSAEGTAMDVQNVTAHEAGHFSGLGDIYNPTDPGYVPPMGSGNQDVTMYGLIAEGETSKRTLEPPDSAGIAYIFNNIPSSRVDLMLVFDGSTSYATTHRAFEPSKASAVELVQKLRVGDRIGVVKLPATVALPLMTISDSASRAQAAAAITSLATGGAAAIGSGLQAAQSQLNLSPLPDHGKNIILFSAGEETGAPSALSVLAPIAAAGTNVYTLGFQGSIGQNLNNIIADSTGGAYFLAADTIINQIVDQIWNTLLGQQYVLNTVVGSDTFDNVSPPGIRWQGPVDSGTLAILPGIRWQGPPLSGSSRPSEGLVGASSYVLTLEQPGGGPLIDSAYAAQHPELGIEFFSGPTFQFFKITNPIPGLWSLFVYGRELPADEEPVVVSITALTDITMAIAFGKINHAIGEPIAMTVALSGGGEASGDPHISGGGPITDATVLASVKPPDPATAVVVPLSHVGGGVYKGTFDDTDTPGTYGVTFNATRDTIERSATEAVFVVPPFVPVVNVVTNPGFESGTAPWVYFTNGGGSYTIDPPGAAANHAAKLTVASSGNNIQFYQSGITLKPNAQYRLTFKAYSNNGRDLSLFLQRHDAPYTNYGLNNVVFGLTNFWKTFTIDFTAINFPPPTPSNARLRFRLNGFAIAGTIYYIDDVTLEEVNAQPLVATNVQVETAPNGTGAIVPAQNLESGNTITVYAISRTATNQFVGNITTTWSLENITGGVVAGDLVPSPDGKSATFTGNLAGTARIKATLAPLNSVLSNVITVVAPPPPPANILVNGGFESGASPWTFNTNGVGSFTIVDQGVVGAKAAQVSITTQGTSVQLYQKDISLTAGQSYRFSFRATCNTGHNVSVSIFKHASPFTPYGLTNFVSTLTNAWQAFSVDFVASGFPGTVTDARLRLWLGIYDANGDLYRFDDIKIEPLPEPAVASKPGESGTPTEFMLAQNYPNPFNPSTTIAYGVPVDAHVTLEVYNILGQRVAQLIDGFTTAGYHSIAFDASDLASGLYVYRMTASTEAGVVSSFSQKMIFTK
ncbi:MAG: carbohydrate binding domain-containing protein [Bacteroidota bacterium]